MACVILVHQLISLTLEAWSPNQWTLGKSLKGFLIYFLKFYLFIFGCSGSSLVHAGFLYFCEQGLLFLLMFWLLVAEHTDLVAP